VVASPVTLYRPTPIAYSAYPETVPQLMCNKPAVLAALHPLWDVGIPAKLQASAELRDPFAPHSGDATID